MLSNVATRHQRSSAGDLTTGRAVVQTRVWILLPEDKEFLFPYYQQLINNVKSRQIDRSRHLYVHIDTDGRAMPVIPLYQEAIGMDMMDPFEVASGCDVVAIGSGYTPTCDHGVPEEVPYENYLHYRKRCVELGG
ncbi:MAG: hypothetical protein O2923_04025 [Verrucomicrobia bacterium]|nr:hypothetical protein [Verrucomicrobiota bacterium]MDA1086356.1 hypothetical protein [Verrucomicrobiota bacterium]